MLLGIDHLVIAVPDPDASVQRLAAALDLTAGGGGRHDRLGTFNRLLWLGDTFVELIGVFDRTLAADSWIGAPTVDALDRGGGLATWAVASDSVESDIGRLRRSGSDLGDAIDGERRRPDGRLVRWRLAAPPTLGTSQPPFLIEHDPTAAEWTPTDRAARAGISLRLAALEIPVEDLDVVASRFRRTLGTGWRPDSARTGRLETRIGPHSVHLVEGEPTTVATIRLASLTRQAMSFDLVGCRWDVEPLTPKSGA